MNKKNNLYTVVFSIIALAFGVYQAYQSGTINNFMQDTFGIELNSNSNTANISTDNLRVTENDIPLYDGSTKNIILNDNKSGLDTSSITDLSFTNLDSLNRVGVADALITPETYSGSENRAEESNISNIKPTGWKNKKINGSYIYNRSHLIGYAFKGVESDTVLNLMTGTRDFNASKDWGMLKYETMVQQAVKSGKTVYYEVNPVFHGDNVVATGVQMRAISEDGSLEFNVFIYNVQDGISIDYSNGTSKKS